MSVLKAINATIQQIQSGAPTSNSSMGQLIRNHFILKSRMEMTLPVERYNSLIHAEQLLYDLMDPKATPRVPREVRNRARGVLRHWPMTSQLEIIAERVPEHFNRSEDPLYTTVKRYDDSR